MQRELSVSRLGSRVWAALSEDGATVEIYAPAEADSAPLGRIFKARVACVLPALQSAFLDIGGPDQAFLHAADVVLPGESEALYGSVPIEDRLRPGRALLVQVVREPHGSKGPRVSGRVSLAGRLLVLTPTAPRRAISRRIAPDSERERLQSLVDDLATPGAGFVVRTAAAGASESALRDESTRLLAEWRGIVQDASIARAPSVIRRESGTLARLLRDAPREGLSRIVLDDPSDRERAIELLQERDPALVARLELHRGPEPLIERLIAVTERALDPRVELPSGGSLVIEQTEALVSVDVNSGRSTGKGTLEATALATNLEAVPEIARQLRLRDLGGIVVIDLIDMADDESRDRVVEAFQEALQNDRAPTRLQGINELGLLELTRKRTRPGLAASLTRPCPDCDGAGRVHAPLLVAARLVAELRRRRGDDRGAEFRVRAHPEVVAHVIDATESDGFALTFVEDPGRLVENFTIERC